MYLTLFLHFEDEATSSHHHPSPASLPHQSPLSLTSSFWQEASGPGCLPPAPPSALLQFSAPDFKQSKVIFSENIMSNEQDEIKDSHEKTTVELEQ